MGIIDTFITKGTRKSLRRLSNEELANLLQSNFMDFALIATRQKALKDECRRRDIVITSEFACASFDNVISHMKNDNDLFCLATAKRESQ